MVAETIIFIIVLAALIIGTYTDFKTREVPDWLNYGLIFIGLGLRIMFSLTYSDLDYIIHGMLGFGAFFIIAVAMFYAGQWGGGDAKMVMGLGALLGLQLSWDTFLLGFFLNIILFGALFGLAYSIYLAIAHHKAFVKEFNKRFAAQKRIKWVIWIGTIVFLLSSALLPFPMRISLVVLAGLIFITFYAFIYLKSVEAVCMIKWIPPEKLTEGDWIVKDIIVDKKRICGPKDLGIEMKQIKKLIALKKKGRIKKVLVKYGIPFVPSFLLAFIGTYLWGNIIFRLLGLA